MSADLTRDAFLGGRLHIWQPRKGYRAGVDAVLLAAAVPARAGQSVLELGCGVGTAALCLHTRVPGLSLTGVEIQPDYADLARRNAEAAAADMQVVFADLRSLPADLRQRRFDHVMLNPPYFDRANGTAAMDDGRDIALGGPTAQADWLDVAIRRLAPKGVLTLIQRIERLPEVLSQLDARVGAVRLMPIAPRIRKPAGLFLLQARHAGRAPFVLNPPLVMHQGDSHAGDQESYTDLVAAILRDAQALSFGD